MQLTRLHVQNFACIGSATIEFGPGLNILYGPQELGKSTLVDAVRAALLVQHSSSHADPWIPWSTDRQPEVELTFQSEPLRIWRISKSFGRSGKSQLDHSKDGVNFGNHARGRQVDGELRTLLRWGVAEGARGLPETFLTNVILPSQRDVTSIFNADLSSDGDESAKAWLTQALEAVAADPLVKRIMNSVQEKVDQVFTPSGKLGRKRSSPFLRLQDEINGFTKSIAEAEKQWQETKRVQDEIQRMKADLLEGQGSVETQRERIAKFQKAVQLRADLQKAKDECERIKKNLAHWIDLKDREQKHSRRLEELQSLLTQARAQVASAAQEFDDAKQALARLASDTVESGRQIQEQGLKNELLTLESRAKDLSGLLERTRQIGANEARLAQCQEDFAAAELEVRKHHDQNLKHTTELERLEGLAVWFAWQESAERLELAISRNQELTDWLEGREKLNAQRQTLSGTLAQQKLPSPQSLKALQKLAEDLLVAEAKLEVGISVEVTPLAPIEFEVAADHEASERRTLTSQMETLEARSELQLTIGNVAQVVIRGGRADAREQVDSLKNRWKSEALPVLQSAGVDNLEELSAAAAQAEKDGETFRSLAKDLQHVNDQIARAGDREGELSSLQKEHELRAQAFATHDRAQLERLAEAYGSIPSAQRVSGVASQISELKKQMTELSINVAKLEVHRDSVRSAINAAETELTKSQEHFSGDWRTVEEASQKEQAEIATKQAAAQGKLVALANQVSQAAADAQEIAAIAEKQWDEQKALLQKLEEEQRQVENDRSQCQGELNGRRESVERLDLDGAEALAVNLALQLQEISEVPAEADESHVQAENRRLEELEAERRQLEREIDGKQGALRQVGGDAARQRLAGLQEALDRKTDEEQELKREFDAWKLLRDALCEVEQKQSAHLGNALAPPLADRLAKLSQGRYQRLDIGPALDIGGIVSSGERRDLDRLSTGTRDQLATLFRFALAEQLQCFLILDDQLTHSDQERLAWFKQILRTGVATRNFQVIVLTCHPTHYLNATEMPSPENATTEFGPIRAVNLKSLIRPIL